MHKSTLWVLPLVFIAMFAAAYLGASLRGYCEKGDSNILIGHMLVAGCR
ncbi:MAG: hypothetical protein ACXV2C_00740 [Candidatus Bathyarchaeia archaeon]